MWLTRELREFSHQEPPLVYIDGGKVSNWGKFIMCPDGIGVNSGELGAETLLCGVDWSHHSRKEKSFKGKSDLLSRTPSKTRGPFHLAYLTESNTDSLLLDIVAIF